MVRMIVCSFYRLVEDRDQRDVDSSLAQLLRTDQAVARRYNDHGGGLVNPVQVLGQIPRKSKSQDLRGFYRKKKRKYIKAG